MSDRENRIAGVMVGMAAGDALGAGYETGKPVPGSGATMCGGGYGFGPGEWTDDTSQAIAVALGRSVPLEVAKGLLSWYWTQPPDVGITTRAVLSRVKSPSGMVLASKAHALRETALGKPVGFDPGVSNGSLMRTGPVCLPYLGNRGRVAYVARQISDLTHFDPSGYTGDACVLWSLFIERAIELDGMVLAMPDLRDGLKFVSAERHGYWEDVIDEATGEPPASFARNSSGCVGAFRVALSAMAYSTSLEEGLQLAVAAGGDTDTTAAIAGALLGAIYGASAVPVQWRKMLHGWPGMDAKDLERLALDAAGVTA